MNKLPQTHVQYSTKHENGNKQMNRPEIDLPFNRRKSMMAAATGIKNNIRSCKEKSRTKQRTSGGCLKYLYSCKWRGGSLDGHLAATLTVPLSVCPVYRGILCDFPCVLYVSLSLISLVYLLSVWLCTHLVIYLPALSPFLHPFLIPPSVNLCPSVSQQRG